MLYNRLSSIILAICLHSGGSAVLYKLRRKVLSQNFIYNRILIKKLVRESSIGFQDTVLEIGSGKGLITLELLNLAKRVIAVEIDPKLALHLEKFLGKNPKLDIYFANFLEFHLPKTSYKVFANIPFSVEGKIIRKLINDKNPPQDCYIVIRRDLAERLSGKYHENQFSLKYKPWFDFRIIHYFKKSDFIPKSRLDCVLWRFTKKLNPILSSDEKVEYQKFIEIAFGQGLPIKQNLKKFLHGRQIDYISRNFGFSLNSKPSYLSLEQWLKLYLCYKNALKYNYEY